VILSNNGIFYYQRQYVCGQLASNQNILQCSKSCGTGIQTRRVECTMRRGNHGPEVPVKDEQCSRSKLRKPKTQRLCQRIACDYIWQEGIWSEVFLYPNLTPVTITIIFAATIFYENLRAILHFHEVVFHITYKVQYRYRMNFFFLSYAQIFKYTCSKGNNN